MCAYARNVVPTNTSRYYRTATHSKDRFGTRIILKPSFSLRLSVPWFCADHRPSWVSQGTTAAGVKLREPIYIGAGYTEDGGIIALKPLTGLIVVVVFVM